MNVKGSGQKRLVIIGATGMVGGYAARYALDNPAVGRVTVISPSARVLGELEPLLLAQLPGVMMSRSAV